MRSASSPATFSFRREGGGLPTAALVVEERPAGEHAFVHSPKTTGGDPPAHVQTRVAERFDLGQARAIPLALQQLKQANVPHVSIEAIRPGRSPPRVGG
jgi:hypothetical protein